MQPRKTLGLEMPTRTLGTSSGSMQPQRARVAQSWAGPAAMRSDLFAKSVQQKAKSFAYSAESRSGRAFGGIERQIDLKLPTFQQQQRLKDMAGRYENLRGKKPHVIAFVNSKSGGQVGGLLMQALNSAISKTENPNFACTGKVCDLSRPDEPEKTISDIAEELSSVAVQDYGPEMRLMVCGGDGTVTWILSALESCDELHGRFQHLPVGIVPLGTGNDLARSLGWGPKLRAVSDILKYLEWVITAAPVTLDQWRLIMRPHQPLAENHKLHEQGSHPQRIEDPEFLEQLHGLMDAEFGDTEDKGSDVYLGFWQNYFSVGMDAKIAGFVDIARGTQCGKAFFQRGLGKVCYALQGARGMVGHDILSTVIRNCRLAPPLEDWRYEMAEASKTKVAGHSATRPSVKGLVANGDPEGEAAKFLGAADMLELSPPLQDQNIQGRFGRARQIMLININSYGAGINVLNALDGRTTRQAAPDDKMLEVLAVRNPACGIGLYMGCLKAAFLASARRLSFTLTCGEWMQLDGEPWKLDVGCDVLVEHHRSLTMLRAPEDAPYWSGHITTSFWEKR